MSRGGGSGFTPPDQAEVALLREVVEEHVKMLVPAGCLPTTYQERWARVLARLVGIAQHVAEPREENHR